MTVRREVETIDEEPVAVREDRVSYREHGHASADEGEVVTRHPDGFSLARGWMRTFNLLVAFMLFLLETLLAFRLAFKLSGANPNNGFVNFVYDLSHPFVAPFEGIASRSTSGSSIFEPETVIAMAVWAVVAVIVIALVNILMSAPAPVEREAVHRERYAHLDRNS
jgi:hypothetical protein